MEFDNSFTVQAPLEYVWNVFTTAEEVAPCVPGAAITEKVDDTHYKGTVKIKLGAVQMSYRGELEMQPDRATNTIVLRAKGTETRGSGGASGVITNRLTESEPGSTRVDIHSQIDVTGRVAQFGRGIMQDVANKMIKDFAACVESKLVAAQSEAPAELESASKSVSVPGEAQQPPAPETTVVPSPRQPQPQTELRALPIIAHVARTRFAALLRAVAEKVEPR